MLKSISVSIVAIALLFHFSYTGQEVENTVDVQIEEWKVPWENSRPRDPYVAPDGDVWFVGQRSDYISEFDIETGEFRRIDLPDGAGPHNLIVDQEGFIWYAGNRAAHIGRVNPENGNIKQYPMPDEQARDPHTLIFDDNGDIWFTVQGGNLVGKLTVSSGKVELIDVPTSRARPYGIKMDSNGTIWVALFGSHKLARINPGTMKLEEIPLEDENSRPRRLGITSDDMVWYVDYSRGYLGKYNPENGSFKEWALPSGSSSRPYGMAVDKQDRIWLVETGVDPNNFVGFDPGTEEFISSTAIESGGGTIRHMYYHKPTNSIWFGTDTNYLGQAKLD